MYFSASDLIKKSASQICYFRNKPKSAPTARQNDGNNYADNNIIGLPEMRGMFRSKYGIICYSFDETLAFVDWLQFREYKYVVDPLTVEPWLLKSSLLQVAFYQALFMLNEDKMLSTATFYVNKGHSSNTIDGSYAKKVSFFLYFGDDRYEVVVKEPYKVVLLFLMKAHMSINYNKSRAYDKEYKFKEYEHLYKCFDVIYLGRK